MKGKKKKRDINAMQCIVTMGSSFLIYYPFFCTCLFTKHFVLLQKQQEPKQVYSTCQQYVIDFLSSLWLIVFTCLRDVFLRYIFAVLKYTVDLVHSAIPCEKGVFFCPC